MHQRNARCRIILNAKCETRRKKCGEAEHPDQIEKSMYLPHRAFFCDVLGVDCTVGIEQFSFLRLFSRARYSPYPGALPSELPTRTGITRGSIAKPTLYSPRFRSHS